MPIMQALRALCLCVLLGVLPVQASPATATGPVAKSKPLRVVFLNPASAAPEEVWWRTCTDFMQAAAKDFGIELKVYYAGRSAAEMYRQAEEAIRGPNKPDFIVMQNMKRTAPTIIRQAAEQGVKVFLFNSALSDDEAAEMGRPRERFPNWIGQLTPDDEAAGYELADLLVNMARQSGRVSGQGKVEMLALGGTVSDSSAIERSEGLSRYVRGHASEIILNRERPLPADWDTEKAKVTLGAAFPAYPQTTVIWSANDKMAIGAREALTSRLGKVPGRDVLIGGIDWNPENLAGVKSGSIAATIGGHFMEGAWVMVLLHDYAQGIDFASQGTVLKSPMSVITRSNLDRFERSLGDRSFEKIDRIDFRQFAKSENPKLKSYSFSLNAVLNQLK